MRTPFDLWSILSGAVRMRNRLFWTLAFSIESIPLRIAPTWRRRRLEHDRTKRRSTR